MEVRPLALNVSPSAGGVSAEYIVPENPACIVTLAHGAGAGMNHSFMVSLAKALADSGVASLRFNFPFIEQKKRRPDLPAVAHKTIEAAVVEVKKSFPKLPLFLSGKSFGGRMSSQFLAARPDKDVKGIIFFGFPLHPAGKPATERADHLKNIAVPMLFLQGTRDELATLELIEQVCSSLKTATLVEIEGADHAFKAGKKDIIPVLVEEAKKWMENK
ncbi:MAG: dienelactone hydrolase family protein [Chitinophagaceae bacterium]|nr:dienelactone hydrolase family protein [Chitinophagaceae bacterium]